jgi:hypothetical protein
MSPNCDLRRASTATPQSLMLMNSDFVLGAARQFSARVRALAGDDRREQIRHAWRLAFTREPDDSELASAATFLEEQTAIFAEQVVQPEGNKERQTTPDEEALASLCQVLFSSNEFLYVD